MPVSSPPFSGGSTTDLTLDDIIADSITLTDRVKVTRATVNDLILTGDTANATNRFEVYSDGDLWWGNGTDAVDTNLYRSAADTLKTDDTLLIGGFGSLAPGGNIVSGGFVTCEGYFNATGNTVGYRWNAAALEQTTVGAAGGASALPATPTKYLKVMDTAGTTLVIPAYAAS
jgi:hypothetical protein